MMIYLVFIASFLIELIDGSHQCVFRGGTISWRPATNDSSVLNTIRTIIIDQRYAWYLSGPNSTCSATTISSNDLIGDSTTKKLTCNPSLTCNAVGFPNNNISTLVPCTSFNSVWGISYGQSSTSLNLSVQTGGFEISYGPGAYWAVLVMGSASAQWQLAMYVNLAPRTDNNCINHSPTSSLSLVIYVPIATNTSISIPMSDEDGDILRCRFSQSSKNMSGIIVNECSGGCYSTALPSSTQLLAIDDNCIMTINLPSLGSYAVAIQIEDFLTNSTVPLSSVPLHFLLSTYTVTTTVTSTTTSTKTTTSTTTSTTSTTSITTSTTSTTSITTSTTSTASITTSTTSTTSTTTLATSTTSITTSTTSITSTTTTTATTTMMTATTTTIKSSDYLPLVLGLSLGLGLPLLLLLSIMVICYKCPWCLRHLRSIINRCYHHNTDVYSQHRQQSTSFNNSQKMKKELNGTCEYRKLYINDDDSSQRRANQEQQYLSSSDLFRSNSMSPFELSSLTRTSLFSPSSNSLPTDRVERISSPASLSPNPIQNTGSILVRAYNKQQDVSYNTISVW